MTERHPHLEYGGTPTLDEAVQGLIGATTIRREGSTVGLSASKTPGFDLVLGLCVALGAAEEFGEDTSRYQLDQSITYPREMRNIINKIVRASKLIRKKGLPAAIDDLRDELDDYRRSPGYEQRLQQRREINESYLGSAGPDPVALYGRRGFTRLYDLVRLDGNLDQHLRQVGSLIRSEGCRIREPFENPQDDMELEAATARRLHTAGSDLTSLVIEHYKK